MGHGTGRRMQSMLGAPEMKALFDRWERVWHDGEFDLVPSCVAPAYLRHEEAGSRVVTPETYAAELAEMKLIRPDVRILVYDHAFSGDRAWFRFMMRWTDQASAEARTRAGIQSYRIEAGKLAETWAVWQPLGSMWDDAVAQKTWTTPIAHD